MFINKCVVIFNMLFKEAVNVFEELEATSSGNEMRVILSSFFKKVGKDEIDKVCYLTLGTIASSYDDVVIGIADKTVIKAVADAVSVSNEKVMKDFKKLGDLGKVVENEVGGKGGKLTVREVFSGLHKIAAAGGTGSQGVKVKTLANLLKKSSAKEAKYIVRIALGNLRMGVGDMTVLDSLAIAFTGDKKNKKILEHAYNVCPDVGLISHTLASRGLKGISSIEVVVGRPVQMMLAQRAKTIEEIKERMAAGVAAEEKYDGERVQIHKRKDKVVFYSRRLDDITAQFPEILDAVKRLRGDFIIEGEIVPFDRKTGAILPFQTLMQRKRKYEIEKYVKEVPVAVFLFDCLYLNGRSLIKEPYIRRTEILKKLLNKTNVLKFVRRVTSVNIDDIEEFFNECVERGTEGIVAKNVSGEYQAGKRGYLWIKWKREYSRELRDTFDLAVVGAFYGKGRRSGGYGALLCAAYDDKTDNFETFCKLGSGFTDKRLSEMPKMLNKYRIAHKPARLKVHSQMKPDVWFNPAVVVEVVGAEITRSPIHSCAEREGVGLALRFPRFVRYREDKKPEQATASGEIEKMVK